MNESMSKTNTTQLAYLLIHLVAVCIAIHCGCIIAANTETDAEMETDADTDTDIYTASTYNSTCNNVCACCKRSG